MMHGNSITPIVVMVNHHLLNNPNQVLACWFTDTIPLGIVVSQIIQDEFFLEIISSYIHRLETWWIIKHYQRHYTKPRNVVLRTRLSYCFLLSIKHGMHWFEELGLISLITSNPHWLKFISIAIGFQGTTSFFSLHVHI